MTIHRFAPIALAIVAPTLTAACDEDGGFLDDTGEEPTSFRLTVEHVGRPFAYVRSGELPALGPGEATEVVFTAGRNQRLVFATMFVESNDFFFAPTGAGVPLYDEDGNARAGDVTANVALWDAGTEVNQEPGLGPDQPPRQAAPGAGAPDDKPWPRLAGNDFDNLPLVADVLQVTLTSSPDQTFRLRLENVSTDQTLRTSDGGRKAVPLSAGVWLLHDGDEALFTLGGVAHEVELEQLAEDAAAAPLAAAVDAESGLETPLAEGAWLLEDTVVDELGFEAAIEDGDPSEIADVLAREGGGRAGVLGAVTPGETAEIYIEAIPGEELSFGSMFLESNDVFLGPSPEGIPLFDEEMPRSGDVTGELDWWDAGTEQNQEPGVGNDQPPRQLEPGTGEAEDEPLVRVDARDDGFIYPAVEETVRVTLTPL